MGGYSPLKIVGNSGGLVQEREEFLLPDDAYPILQNAYVWREKLLRKSGFQLLGRLQRNLTNKTLTSLDGSGNYSNTLISDVPLLSTSTLVPGTVVVTVTGGGVFTDQGDGTMKRVGGSGTATINYATTKLIITGGGAGRAVSANFSYYPGLPVMGIRTQELANSANDQTIFFDQKYAYTYNGSTQQFQEFISGTTWNAQSNGVQATDFFWSTNYWVSDNTNFSTTGFKLFWVTNNTGYAGANADPIRVTDGTSWLNFQPPTYGQIDATNFVWGCLSFLPFRGRLVMFNTFEGSAFGVGVNFSNRVRWSTIGNPFLPFSAGPPATGSWRDDIRGQGGFLDIPTSEDIVAVGFVRDNLVIYCERSTWQLRYTGRSIAPFQIERVNSELGAQGPFSAIQFDTSLVGIGDKGVVECDSYKSERIDIKIPDYVFKFNDNNQAPSRIDGNRVHGIRDFVNRLAYWTVSIENVYDPNIPTANQIFPNQRLVYNYENDSWALFDDSITSLGTFQIDSGLTWLQINATWLQCNFPWINEAAEAPIIVGGNQQGFVLVMDILTTNDASLMITAITGDASLTNPVVITSPNHNMSTNFVIGISGITASDPFVSLNGGVYGIYVIDQNTFSIFTYNATTNLFDTPVILATGTYIGAGYINIRENFMINSKKFNFLDEGQNIQLGYIDILMKSTTSDEPGAISLNVYLDYNDNEASNTVPMNDISDISGPAIPDTFFNAIIPTTAATYSNVGGTKFWQRVYCATRASFLTLQYTFSNSQMAGIEQTLDVQIDAQILWIRKGGRMSQG